MRRLGLQVGHQAGHQVGLQGGYEEVLHVIRCYQMDQKLLRLISELSLRVQRFQGKEGSFQGQGGRKLLREGRKEGFG